MKFHIITIFPHILDSYLQESIIKRAQNKKIIQVKTHNLRDWTTNRRQNVDAPPYGGGAGMLMKAEPIYQAIKDIKRKSLVRKKERKIILLSATGQKWNQKLAKKYSQLKEIVFICGRYEGVDNRVKNFIDKEVSIGDYVLTGGELPAMVMIDTIARLLPNALGNKESVKQESHSLIGIGEYPQYTRPQEFKIGSKKYKVPKILLSGNHQKIKEWKNKKQKKLS